MGFLAIATLGTSILPTQAQASTIVLNSGQVITGSGMPGDTDINITYWTKGIAVYPLSPNPFTTADFDKAKGIGCVTSGPNPDICDSAKVVAPYSPPTWIPSLPSAPNARWINWKDDFSLGFPGASVLYAYRFTVPEPTINNAAIKMYWAVDDFLGEYPGYPDPNPIGVYINGYALNSSFSGVGRDQEYSASQSIPSNWLNPGSNNWLYVYQRDAGGSPSGTIFGAHIRVNVPEPSSIIGLAVLSTLGAASTLKRKLKPSQSSEKETTKVG